MRKKKICFLIVWIQIFVIFFSGCHVTRHTVFPDVWEQAQTYQQLGYPSIRRYTGMIATTNDYLSNRGLQHEGIIVDPYFTVTANGVSIPSYAAAVYSGLRMPALFTVFALLKRICRSNRFSYLLPLWRRFWSLASFQIPGTPIYLLSIKL